METGHITNSGGLRRENRPQPAYRDKNTSFVIIVMYNHRKHENVENVDIFHPDLHKSNVGAIQKIAHSRLGRICVIAAWLRKNYQNGRSGELCSPHPVTLNVYD